MQADTGSKIDANQRDLLAWLAQLVRTRMLTQQELAAASGVHQSQVSRILAGSVKRPSRNIDRLCNYAKSRRRPGRADRRGSAALPQVLAGVLSRVWDGSEEHAHALVDLLEAVDRVQVATRRDPPC